MLARGSINLVRLPTLCRNSYLWLLHPVCAMGGGLPRASNQKIRYHEPRDVTLMTDRLELKSKLAPGNGRNRFKIQFHISRILNFKIIVPISHCHVTDFKKVISNFIFQNDQFFVSYSSPFTVTSNKHTHSFRCCSPLVYICVFASTSPSLVRLFLPFFVCSL